MNRRSLLDSIELSTRRRRRDAVKLAMDLVAGIHLAESGYMERIPANLQGGDAYQAAEQALDYLVEAIDALEAAYE